MRAGAAAWMMDPARPPSAGAETAYDRRTLELTARLAAVMARPSRHVDARRLAFGPFGPAEIAAMTAHPAFAAPVESALATALGLPGLAIAPAFIQRLPASVAARTAVMVATAPMEALRRLALDLAGVVLHRRIVALILRADRERVRAALGEDAFVIATHEAPILYPTLADLDTAGTRFDLAATAEAPDGLARYACLILSRFLAGQDVALAQLFDLRWPPSTHATRREDLVAALNPAQTEAIVRFIRRRQPSWSAITD